MRLIRFIRSDSSDPDQDQMIRFISSSGHQIIGSSCEHERDHELLFLTNFQQTSTRPAQLLMSSAAQPLRQNDPKPLELHKMNKANFNHSQVLGIDLAKNQEITKFSRNLNLDFELFKPALTFSSWLENHVVKLKHPPKKRKMHEEAEMHFQPRTLRQTFQFKGW